MIITNNAKGKGFPVKICIDSVDVLTKYLPLKVIILSTSLLKE